MLKALLLLLTNLALAGMATAQNLVLNGSFEDTVDCEVGTQCLLLKAAHWYNPNIATPDVWDADLVRECGYPLDPDGFPGLWYLTPFEGIRHAGAYYWYGPGSSDTRDYMMTKLSTSLEAGAGYEVSLRYALRRTFQYAVDHIGVWLGDDSLFEYTPNWLSVTPQIRLRDPESIYLAENEEWTLLKDTLVASGDEQWMVIGNFDVADSVNGTSAYPNAFNAYAYYYIDSVSVRPVDLHTSIVEAELSAGWWADGLWVRWLPGMVISEVWFFDAQGRCIATHRTQTGANNTQLQLSPISPGLYIVQGVGPFGKISARIIKE